MPAKSDRRPTPMAELSTKPYLIRAIHQWCEDSGYRPYLAVMVDERTQVPREFVRNGEIVLNVSAVATNRLLIGNDLIEFEARFSGAVRQVSIPIENVSAIYAQETGHGMAFDVPKPLAIAPERGPSESGGKAALADKAPKAAQRPKLVPPPAERGKEPVTNTPDLAGTHRPDRPQDALPEAGSAPVLQAVESAPTGRAARSAAAPKSRRRGKLSAVPDAGEPASADAASIEPAAKAPDSQAASHSTDTPSPSEPPPDEPPPSPPTRPQLKRVK